MIICVTGRYSLSKWTITFGFSVAGWNVSAVRNFSFVFRPFLVLEFEYIVWVVLVDDDVLVDVVLSLHKFITSANLIKEIQIIEIHFYMINYLILKYFMIFRIRSHRRNLLAERLSCEFLLKFRHIFCLKITVAIYDLHTILSL